MLVEKRHIFWHSETPRKALQSCWNISRIVGQMVGQTLDSVFDAIYFINLKRSPRMIHVDPKIQVIQAILLFTCKYFTSLIVLYLFLFQP